MDLEAVSSAAADLREQLQVARVTVRLIDEQGESELVAEALADGQPAVLTVSATQDDPASTYQWILREKRLLVQDDVVGAVPSPPAELLSVLGIRAQMLAPIVRERRVIAVMSVHHFGGTRQWSAEDGWHVGRAAQRVASSI